MLMSTWMLQMFYVILIGLLQEVGELMRATERNNMTGHFTWIGSDGWGGRVLVSNGNEAQVRNYIQVIVIIYKYEIEKKVRAPKFLSQHSHHRHTSSLPTTQKEHYLIYEMKNFKYL